MKNFFYRWKWLVGALLFIAFALTLSLDLIVSQTIENVFYRSISKTNNHLSFEKIVKQNSLWVIKQPKICPQGCKDQPLCTASEITFDYSIHWLKREIELLIVLDKPEICLNQLSLNQISWNDEAADSFTLFKTNVQISLKEGHLNTDKGIFAFDGSFQRNSSIEGSINLKDSSQNLLLNFKKDPLSETIDVNFDSSNTNCAHLCTIAQLFFPQLESFTIKEGFLNGQGGLLFEKRKRPVLHGTWNLKNLVFEHIQTELLGEIPEIIFDLERKDNKYSQGTIRLTKEANFQVKSATSPSWKVNKLLGDIHIDTQSEADIHLKGIYKGLETSFDLSIDGKALALHDQNAQIHLDWTLKNSDEMSSGKLHLNQKNVNQYEAEIDLKDLQLKEALPLQTYLQTLWPTFSELEFQKGLLNAKAIAYIDQKKISKLELNTMHVDHLLVDYFPLKMRASLESLSGKGTIDFLRDYLEEGITAQIDIDKGVISSLNSSTKWMANDFQSHLNISNGRILHSFAEINIGNMRARLDIDADSTRIAKVSLNGNILYLLNLIPNEVKRQKLLESFESYELNLAADVKYSEVGKNVIGLATFKDDRHVEKPVTFGFEISKSESLIENAFAYIESLQECLPPLANPLLSLEEQHWKNEVGLWGYCIKNGWFHVTDLPLDKYVAPFFVNEKKLKLEGVGNFEGRFDHQTLMINYEIHKAVLENNDLAIQIPEIKNTPIGFSSNQAKPVYYMDFDLGNYFGCVPLVNATYFEKSSGLLFTDINAEIVLEGNNIHVPTIESFCNGVYMMGAMDVDFTDKREGHFDLDMRFQSLNGKLTQFQNLFAHFRKPLFFLKMPMEGVISMHQDAGYMHFAFHPDKYDFQARVKGSLSEGVITTSSPDVAIQELGFNFEYDYKDNILDFSEIQGTVLVGEPEKVEEYSLVGERVHFFDYAKNRASFDFWIADRKRDLIRIAGETYSSDSYPNLDCVQFVLNRELSHFGDVHPSHFHLILRDWWQVMEFRLEADFKLATFFQDLQRFSRSGFLFLSRNILKRLNDIKNAEGLFNISIQYDDQQATLDYHLIGKDVVLDEYFFNTVSLDGKKSNSTWTIDQLKLDDISIAADILRKEKSWFINFLGLKIGKAILMGLQGEYFDDLRRAKGQVNLLEINIKELNKIPMLQTFVQKCPLTGHFKATGEFQYEVQDNQSWGKLETLLNASLKNCEFKGQCFKDIENVSCHYASDKQIQLKKIETALLKDKKNKYADFRLEKFEYDIRQDQLSLENFDFFITQQNISEMVDKLVENFPTLFTENFAKTAKSVKQKGPLEGRLNIDFAGPHHSIKLALKDGEYRIFNKDYSITNFNLEHNPFEFKMTAKCLDHAVPFWALYKSTPAEMDKGSLTITEEPPQIPVLNPLVINWETNPKVGFIINQASGYFHGMMVSLFRDTHRPIAPNFYFLNGEVAFNAKQAGKMISQELEQSLHSWEIGNGYRLNGQWEFRQEDEDGDRLSSYFFGELTGNNFEFKSYQFDQLNAQIQTSPHQVLIQNIEVNDVCGHLQIDKIKFDRYGDNKWRMFVDKGMLEEFSPSLLRKVGEASTLTTKPLVIRQAELHRLQGSLNDPNSFTGTGFLVFANPPKKQTQFPLFAIPGEILTRIGLDLAVLNPVVGTIYYDVKNGKVFLTKLKDVYSQGKMSKFYLPSSSLMSYVDFDGNLNVKIKMKQYNLIFKFAELFTVTIQGNLQKPSYTLNKQ